MKIYKDFIVAINGVLFSFRNLAHNKLTGPLPDLTTMDTLNYV